MPLHKRMPGSASAPSFGAGIAPSAGPCLMRRWLQRCSRLGFGHGPRPTLFRRLRAAAALVPVLVLGPVLSPGVAWAQAAPLPAVVVWDFENQTPGAAAPGERGAFLKRSLSENLTVTLLQVAGLPVVERQRLKDVLAEQKLTAGALADELTRLRLGKIIGAQRMVFGGYFVLGDAVQVHVRVIDTATSRVVFSDEAAAPLAQVMAQVAPMNQRLAMALGGGAAAGGPPAHTAATWQAYDQALALADAGDFDAAVQALQGVLARDKTFTPAERQLMTLLDRMARR